MLVLKPGYNYEIKFKDKLLEPSYTPTEYNLALTVLVYS